MQMLGRSWAASWVLILSIAMLTLAQEPEAKESVVLNTERGDAMIAEYFRPGNSETGRLVSDGCEDAGRLDLASGTVRSPTLRNARARSPA